MPISGAKQQRFNAQLDQAAEAAKAALAPVFEGGAYDLSEDELSLLSEISFKLGMPRVVIIEQGLIADQIVARRQEKKERLAAAVLRLEQPSSNQLR